MTRDRALVRERYGRSLAAYDGEAALQRQLARRLVEAIRRHGGGRHDSVLEIGCGTGFLSRELVRGLRLRRLVANDLVEACGPRVAEIVKEQPEVEYGFMAGDIERLELPAAGFDLVASNAVFHWLDDPAALLARLAGALRAGGLLAFTTFGPDNLREVAAVGGGGLPYRTLDEVAALVGQRYSILGRDESREVLWFASPRRVLEHLRRTGANALTRAGWTRRRLLAFETEYRERFGAGGEVTLTYHPQLIVARRRDEHHSA